jgi:ATP-dependent DNA ligase
MGRKISAKTRTKNFPAIRLPIRPPYPPAESNPEEETPTGAGWLYEPRGDGFRGLAFRDGKRVLLQSKAGQPLHRHFPKLLQALAEFPHSRFVLDGEILTYVGKQLFFDRLLMHPPSGIQSS